jgi:hypothetical protein
MRREGGLMTTGRGQDAFTLAGWNDIELHRGDIAVLTPKHITLYTPNSPSWHPERKQSPKRKKLSLF